MSLMVASRPSTQEIIATGNPTAPSLDRESSHRKSSLAITRLATRSEERRLRTQNAQISRPNEQIDSTDEVDGSSECEKTFSRADEKSNEPLTSDRIANVTSQLQTSSELGKSACSPQNLWREPQSIPNCKPQVYVYTHSNSVIEEDHLKRYPIVIDIFKRNIEQMSELKLHMCEIDFTLKMCGPSPEISHPSIIVFCTRAVFPSLRSLLTSRHIVSQYYFPKPSRSTSIWRSILKSDEEAPGDSQIPRFKIYFWWAKKMPRTLLWGRLGNLRVDQPCRNSLAELEALTMCGSRIAATESIRLATLGCLVKVQSNFYGLSASHAFESIMRSTPLVIEASVDNPLSDASVSVHSVTSQKGKDAYSLVDDVEYDSDDDVSSVDSIPPSDDKSDFRLASPQNSTEEIMEGNIMFPCDDFFAGTRKPDLDWALIEIKEEQYKRPNAYISVTEPSKPIFFSKAAAGHPGEQRDIVVISSALNPRRGILLPGKSFLGGINRPNMSEVWSILLTGEQVLSRGDSGSLVIDLDTNEVYGHVVASNPLGEAYVVPLLATLGQIKESFHTEDVSLPETLDFKNLQEYEQISRKETLITEPDGLTTLPPSHESNPPSNNITDLASQIHGKQSSISQGLLRIVNGFGSTLFVVLISQPELLRRHSLRLTILLDGRNTDREIRLIVDSQADFDASEVAWLIENLQLTRLDSLDQVNDLKALARTCAVIWAYQCDPKLFENLESIIRPKSHVRWHSSSIETVDFTTVVSRWWQGKNDIAICGQLITIAFVLGLSDILEDEIKVAVWGTDKEVKVLANLGIDIGDLRKVELGNLFDEVFYLIFEIDDEDEHLARSIRETLKQNLGGDFSKRWQRNSERFQDWTPYDFLITMGNVFTPQLAQSSANDTPRINLAGLVQNAGVSILDSRDKQGDQEKETMRAILDGLEILVSRRGRELAKRLMNQRDAHVQGWRDELQPRAGSSSFERVNSRMGTINSTFVAKREFRFEAEMPSHGTAMKPSLGAEVKIKGGRPLTKVKAVRMPQDV